jgi:hypothetical protein
VCLWLEYLWRVCSYPFYCALSERCESALAPRADTALEHTHLVPAPTSCNTSGTRGTPLKHPRHTSRTTVEVEVKPRLRLPHTNVHMRSRALSLSQCKRGDTRCQKCKTKLVSPSPPPHPLGNVFASGSCADGRLRPQLSSEACQPCTQASSGCMFTLHFICVVKRARAQSISI